MARSRGQKWSDMPIRPRRSASGENVTLLPSKADIDHGGRYALVEIEFGQKVAAEEIHSGISGGTVPSTFSPFLSFSYMCSVQSSVWLEMDEGGDVVDAGEGPTTAAAEINRLNTFTSHLDPFPYLLTAKYPIVLQSLKAICLLEMSLRPPSLYREG